MVRQKQSQTEQSEQAKSEDSVTPEKTSNKDLLNKISNIGIKTKLSSFFAVVFGLSLKVKLTAAFTLLVVAAGSVAGAYLLTGHGVPSVKSTVTIEAGSAFPNASVFAANEEDILIYTTDTSGVSMNKPGSIDLTVFVNDIIEHDVVLHIVDTIPPTATSHNLMIAQTEEKTANDFVTDINDVTNVTVAFKEGEEPDFLQIGAQELTIVLTDEGDNVTELPVSLYVFGINGGITIEAGTNILELPIKDFLMKNEDLADIYDEIPLSFNRGISLPQSKTVGEYDVNIILSQTVFKSKITVEDTTPPTATSVDIIKYVGQKVEPMDFIEDAHDYSEFTASFLTEPDLRTVGTQEITVILEDFWGNAAEFTSELTIRKNTIPPRIRGATNMTVFVGARVLFRSGVSAWSVVDGEIPFTVDNSQVNINAVGRYPVTYTATDSGGLKTTVTVYVTVVVYTPRSVYDVADDILARIGTSRMGQREKVIAIHRWVTSNIRYGSNAETDRLRAASSGFSRRIGNCYTFYAVSSVLLERAGISNQRIVRAPGGARATNHSWNLVNIGGVWYHYDSTPSRSSGGAIFTSADAHRITTSVSPGYYHYNPANYPRIAGQSATTQTNETPPATTPATNPPAGGGGGTDHGSGSDTTPQTCACGTVGCTNSNPFCTTCNSHTCTVCPCGSHPCTNLNPYCSTCNSHTCSACSCGTHNCPGHVCSDCGDDPCTC